MGGIEMKELYDYSLGGYTRGACNEVLETVKHVEVELKGTDPE